MRHEIKIILYWLAMTAAVRLLLFLPHREIEPIGLINVSLQLLLFVVSIDIARNSVFAQKYVFVNFSVFFGIIVPLLLGAFIGTTLFLDDPYAGTFYYLYLNH